MAEGYLDKIYFYGLHFVIFPILIGYSVYLTYSLHYFKEFRQTGV